MNSIYYDYLQSALHIVYPGAAYIIIILCY